MYHISTNLNIPITELLVKRITLSAKLKYAVYFNANDSVLNCNKSGPWFYLICPPFSHCSGKEGALWSCVPAIATTGKKHCQASPSCFLPCYKSGYVAVSEILLASHLVSIFFTNGHFSLYDLSNDLCWISKQTEHGQALPLGKTPYQPNPDYSFFLLIP